MIMMMKKRRGETTAILAVVLAILGGGLLVSGSRGLVGAQADGASPPRPSHVHTGDCDEPGAVIQPLTALAVPGGEFSGNADAVLAEAAFTQIPRTLDELLADDHSVKIHLSKERIETYLACGDIGGTVDGQGALIVGLKEQDGSGYAGIAYLVPAGGGTSVSVMIAKMLPGGGAGDDAAAPDAAAPAVADAPADPAAADADGDVPTVGVVLNEFSIAMPTELKAGPTRFNVTNVGAAQHNLIIQGEGTDERLAEENLAPRTSASIELDLAPGTYTVFCPVGEGAHRANGMEVTLTVT